MPRPIADPKEGRRAEEVASWYFRLNGFLSIPGFIVHPDTRRRYPRTEADLIGVRFPYSREDISTRRMVDDKPLTSVDETGVRTVFVLVEVKKDLCTVNGPWANRSHGNVERAVRRLGFAEEASVKAVADGVYTSARWADDYFLVQYVCIGARKNPGKQSQLLGLLQIDWGEIARFLAERFGAFPEKLPDHGPVHQQWPDFGRSYGEWFATHARGLAADDERLAASREAIDRYIETGSCSDQLST